MPVKETATWTPFYFDGNAYFGEITSRETWREVVKAYREAHPSYSDEDIVVFLRNRVLENAGSAEKYGMPRFGFYTEYQGPLTLGQWADQQGMDLKD